MNIDKKYYKYVQQIKKNEIPHCEAVALSIKRFESDLKKSKQDTYPFYFDEEKADKTIKFIEQLKQFEGEFAGKELILEPWQAYVIANLIGWRHRGNPNLKRFRRCFIMVARKNGKSMLFSALALIDLLTEPGAQVVSMATKREQAKIILKNLKQMIRQNPDLKKVLKTYRDEIQNTELDGTFKCLSRDSESQDGLNVSYGLADEVAAMKDSYLIDVIESSQGSRSNPMLIEITTAGYNFNSPGYDEWTKSKKILNGSLVDEEFFTIIFEYDKEDKWDDPTKFIKANPNLNVSVKESDLISQLTNAKNSGKKRPEFMTKRCNIWLKSFDAWVTPDDLKKTIQPFKKNLEDYPCFGAIDLSTSNDFTAYTKCWYIPEIRKFVFRHKFYIPEDSIAEKFDTDSNLIYEWVEKDFITACVGNTVDYDYLIDDIKEDISKYNLRLAFDPNKECGTLKEFNSISAPFAQYAGNFTAPIMKFSSELDKGNIIDLDDNPVWRWMMMNACTKEKQNTHYKMITKVNNNKGSGQRIDGVITTLMAIGIAIGNQEEVQEKTFAKIDFSLLK